MENQQAEKIQFSLEEASQTKKILKVEVTKEEIDQEYLKAYKSLQKTAKFPGFRPGKAPLQMVRRLLGRQVHEDLVQKVVPRYYSQVVERAALIPVDLPIIRNIHLKEGEALRFDATVYVKPDFEVKDYKGIPIPEKKPEIKEEVVDRILLTMREDLAELSSYEDDEHQVEKGDVVEADFHGFIDNEPLQGGKAESHLVEVGAGSLIPELEDGFLGMKRGEKKEITAAFPEDYRNKPMAGKTAVFQVHAKDVKQKKLPELDDEFAKDVGEKYGTLDELKEAIREGIRQREDKRIREELHLDIMDEVLGRNPIEELPEVMVLRQKKSLKESMESHLRASGAKPKGKDLEGMLPDEKIEEKARRDVAWSLILDQILEKEGIRLTAAEVEHALEERAMEASMTKEVLKELYEEQAGSLEPFRLMLLNEKALDFLLENAKVTSKEPLQQADKSEE